MSFIKQCSASIYKFREYPMLLLNKASHVVIYYILFSLLIAILSCVPIVKTYYEIGGINGIFEKYIPKFNITDGRLDCETLIKDVYDVKIYINTKEKFDFSDVIGDSQTYIIADSENYAVNNGLQKMTGTFSDFGNITSEEINEYVSQKAFVVVFMLMLIFTMFVNQVLIGIGSLCMVALLINIMNMMITRCNLSFGNLFKLAVYIKTFPTILNTLFLIFGISLNAIVYIGILIAYIYLALKNIQNNKGIIIAEI